MIGLLLGGVIGVAGKALLGALVGGVITCAVINRQTIFEAAREKVKELFSKVRSVILYIRQKRKGAATVEVYPLQEVVDQMIAGRDAITLDELDALGVESTTMELEAEEDADDVEEEEMYWIEV